MVLILRKANSIEQYFSKETLAKLSISNQYFTKKTRNTIFFTSLIFMIIALSRPVTNERVHESKKELNAVIVAIDASKSMMANDIYPNRLGFSKKKLLDILELSKTNALGVILFAKSSFILSPATQDFASLKLIIQNLNTGINFDNGTNIYSTLETTNKLLKNFKNKNLILLTDGADKDDFSEEIQFAKKNNINIFTIATATKKGSAIKLKDGNYLVDKSGNIVTVKLNENIKTLSLETNGGYINYSLDSNDITQILNAINTKSQKQEFQEKKFKTYTELFYYPLSLAIILLLIAFSSLPTFKNRKKSENIVKSLLILSLLTLSTNLKAELFEFKTIDKANEAYKNKKFEDAKKEYSELSQSEQKDYNLANSLYKNKNYKEAIKQYKNIDSVNNDMNYKKLHNLGNSYVQTKQLQEAKKAYANALKLKNDTQTKENLDLVNKALKKKDEEKKKNQDKKENKDSKDSKDKKNEQKKENSDKKKDSKDGENKKPKDDKKDKKEKDKKENKKKQDQKKQDAKQKSGEIKKDEISDLEEKKWLNQLKHQQTNSLMKKMESSKEDNSSNPW
jgi:Ca-activated chloride channel family protein